MRAAHPVPAVAQPAELERPIMHPQTPAARGVCSRAPTLETTEGIAAARARHSLLRATRAVAPTHEGNIPQYCDRN